MKDKQRPDEKALRAAWQGLADKTNDMPAPDIRPRLRSRLNATTSRPPKRASVGSLATIGAVVCTLSLIVWGLKNPGQATEVPPTHPHTVALLPAKASVEEASLAEMLQEVRGRSFEERSEPPAYNETTRALLLPGKGNGK